MDKFEKVITAGLLLICSAAIIVITCVYITSANNTKNFACSHELTVEKIDESTIRVTQVPALNGCEK